MLETLILLQTADLIHDPVIASDQQGRVVFTNKAHSILSAWPSDEAKGLNYQLLCDIPKTSLGVESEGVGVLYRKDGTKLTLPFTSSPISHPQDKNLRLGQIAIFHPKLDRETVSLSDDFVSTVSHEIRTPLTSIKGFADTLINSSHRLDDEKKKRFLQIIKDQADHVTRLVEDLLLVSRLDNQKIHLVMRPIDLKKNLDKACEAFGNQAGGRIFHYELEPNLPQLYTDSDRLEQILTNLISNAIKYSHDHSPIVLRALREDRRLLKISVIDAGVGISAEEQEIIFNRFSRADNPLTRKIKGTGLGLYITKSLIGALGGEIWLEKSSPGETVFSFTLPIHEG